MNMIHSHILLYMCFLSMPRIFYSDIEDHNKKSKRNKLNKSRKIILALCIYIYEKFNLNKLNKD